MSGITDFEVQLSRKLMIRGDGDIISVDFEPTAHCKVRVEFPGGSEERWQGMAFPGAVKSTRKGSGEFESKYAFALNLRGTYKLQIGSRTARLFEDDEQIWFGTGTQEGLDGEFLIDFPPKETSQGE